MVTSLVQQNPSVRYIVLMTSLTSLPDHSPNSAAMEDVGWAHVMEVAEAYKERKKQGVLLRVQLTS